MSEVPKTETTAPAVGVHRFVRLWRDLFRRSNKVQPQRPWRYEVRYKDLREGPVAIGPYTVWGSFEGNFVNDVEIPFISVSDGNGIVTSQLEFHADRVFFEPNIE